MSKEKKGGGCSGAIGSIVIVAIITVVVVAILIPILGGSDEEPDAQNETESFQEQISKNNPPVEAPKEKPVEEPVEEPPQPDWYGVTYTVTTYDPATDSYIDNVALWTTSDFDNPNRKRTDDRFVEGDKVILVGYNEEEDYCRVTTGSVDNTPLGWFACGWLKELPEEMKNLWTDPI